MRIFRSVILLFCLGCSSESGIYKYKILTSSNGKRVYVKSYNWGQTSDSQISTISDEDSELKLNDKDKSYVIKGLQPFIYRFKNDTLEIYYKSSITHFPIKQKDIYIKYINTDTYKYDDLLQKSMKNAEFHSVPEYERSEYEGVPKPGEESH